MSGIFSGKSWGADAEHLNPTNTLHLIGTRSTGDFTHRRSHSSLKGFWLSKCFCFVVTCCTSSRALGWAKRLAGVLVGAQAGARVGVSLSLVSGTIDRVSFLSRSPSLRASSDSEASGNVVALQRRRRLLPEARTRNLVHVLVGGLTSMLVGRRCYGGYVGVGTRDEGWVGFRFRLCLEPFIAFLFFE